MFGFGIRDSGFGFLVSMFGFGISGSGIRVQGFDVRVWRLGSAWARSAALAELKLDKPSDPFLCASSNLYRNTSLIRTCPPP